MKDDLLKMQKLKRKEHLKLVLHIRKEDKMKTGILSMQRVNNYGSLLQAYGLKKTIELLGSEVEFIDIKKNEYDYNLLNNKTKCEIKNKIKLKMILDKSNFIKFHNEIIRRQLIYKCDEFRKKYLDIEKKSSHYDICVIGSDEVFNCLNSGWWGYTSQLFGNVPEADKIITYAASCGATQYNHLPTDIRISIKKAMSGILGLSVRDENTYQFVKSFGIDNAVSNFDPVLIYNFDEEIKRVDLPNVPKHYCIIYSYFYRFEKKEEKDAILSFCKKNKITPIALQGGQTWCKNFISCSPFECLKLFQNADFVITDTFHGTIFSVKYAKRFAVIIRESNYNKLNDLIRKLGIQKHLVNNISELETVYHLDKKQQSIENIINVERTRTLNYLRKYINEKK